MDKLHQLFVTAKTSYDAGSNPLEEVFLTSLYALKLLDKIASRQQGQAGPKSYNIFYTEKTFSRPLLASSFITDPDLFRENWNQLIASFVPKKNKADLDPIKINSVLYTCLGAFAVAYDLWKPSSRKTPGTFFEILVGSVIASLIPNFKRTKHVVFGEDTEEESLSTDIVFSKDEGKTGLILPVKITTRERIVQPFAHQRICDSVFGEGHFKSLLICMSELQRNKDLGVNEICVPGTIKLFQKHLAKLTGMYYLDPPIRYLNPSISSLLRVASIGDLLSSDLPALAAI